MFKITDKHIDYMLIDLNKRGIVLESLKANIIDHICCLAEEELSENGNFEAYYTQIISRFFNQELKELQQETDSLTHSKNIDNLKYLIQVSGVLSVLFLSFGSYYKLNYLAGTGIILCIGMLLFCLLFLPSLIILKMKDLDSKQNTILVFIGFLLTFFIGTGCLFKIMQWPYATLIIAISISVFILLFIPLYSLVKQKQSKQKFIIFINVIIMLVVSIMLLIMTL